MTVGSDRNDVRFLSGEVCFFLGAGASVGAGVPTTAGFLEEFRKVVRKEKRRGDFRFLSDLEEKLASFLRDQGKEATFDIELTLHFLSVIAEAEEHYAFAYFGKLPGNGNRKRALRLLERLKRLICERMTVEKNKVRWLEKLTGFTAREQPLDIFTANYDNVIEQFCEINRIKYSDGFDVEWNPTRFEELDLRIRLFKLHGSVTWYIDDTGRYLKVPVSTQELQLQSGEKAKPLLLYPMRKTEYFEPFAECLIRLRKTLEDKRTGWAMVVGYSFRDDDILRVFWEAARKNSKLKIVLIDPRAHEIYDKRLAWYETKKEKSHLHDRVICVPFRYDLFVPYLAKWHIKRFEPAALVSEKATYLDSQGENLLPHDLLGKFSFAYWIHEFEHWNNEAPYLANHKIKGSAIAFLRFVVWSLSNTLTDKYVDFLTRFRDIAFSVIDKCNVVVAGEKYRLGSSWLLEFIQNIEYYNDTDIAKFSMCTMPGKAEKLQQFSVLLKQLCSYVKNYLEGPLDHVLSGDIFERSGSFFEHRTDAEQYTQTSDSLEKQRLISQIILRHFHFFFGYFSEKAKKIVG